MIGWAADFKKFKSKVEGSFGDIRILAKNWPDLYAHQVLSHGFMEYAGTKNLFHNKHLKREYLKWAKENALEEKLLEEGWQEFLDD